MISRSQFGVSRGTAFNAQWKSDMAAIFGAENVSTSGNVTTAVIGDGLEIRSTYSTQSGIETTTVRLYYGSSTLIIGTTNSDNKYAYRIVKFDNGVIAFSGFQNAANADSLDAHMNPKRLVYFICDVDDVTQTETTVKAFFEAEGSGSDPDSVNYYTGYIGTTNGALAAYYNSDATNVINSPMTILIPAFIRSMPYITECLYLKMQSQGQYGEILLNGTRYLSCASFCVPLGENE